MFNDLEKKDNNNEDKEDSLLYNNDIKQNNNSDDESKNNRNISLLYKNSNQIIDKNIDIINNDCLYLIERPLKNIIGITNIKKKAIYLIFI